MNASTQKIRSAFEQGRPADTTTNELEQEWIYLRMNSINIANQKGDQLVDLIGDELDLRADGDPEQGVAGLIGRLSRD